MVEDGGVDEGRDGGAGVQEFLGTSLWPSAPDAFDVFRYEFFDVLRVHGTQFLPQIGSDCLEFSLIEPDSVTLRAPIDNDGGLAEDDGDHFGGLAFHAGAAGHKCACLLHVFDLVVQPAHRAVVHLVLQFSKLVFDQPDSLALWASFKVHGENGIHKQILHTHRTNICGNLLLDRVLDRRNFHGEIRLRASLFDSLVPVRNVDVVDEVGEAVTLDRSVFSEDVIDQIQLAAVQPDTAAVSA